MVARKQRLFPCKPLLATAFAAARLRRPGKQPLFPCKASLVVAAAAASLRLAVPFGCLGGCVVVEERPTFEAMAAQPIVATPIAIPLGEGVAAPAAPHDLYYTSVLAQMRLAWVDRDAVVLRGFLDQHDRPDTPGWAKTQFQHLRTAVATLEFEALIAERSGIELDEAQPALGEPISGRVSVGPLTAPVRLFGGGEANPTRFLVRLELDDRDAFGDTATRHSSAIVALPAPVDFTAGGVAELPFSVAAPAAGSILRTVRIVVELLPGCVQAGETSLPNGRVRIAASEHTLFPRGIEAIRAQPLVTLRNALQSGEVRHFANVYLAAHFLARDPDPAVLHDALGMLVDKIRLGRSDQVRMAIAAATTLVADAPELADRAAWLRWWGARQDAAAPARGRPR